MIQGQWPEVPFILVRPPQGSMYHHSPGSPLNILYSVFSCTIVMVTSNPTVLDALIRFGKLSQELLGSVDSIVCLVILYTYANLKSLLLKGQLSSHSLMGVEAHLVHNSYLPASSIVEKRATAVLL